MRKWHLLLVLSAGGALAGFVACGGSSNNPPANGDNDAGATADAAKDSANGAVDGAGQDAGTDSSATGCIDAGTLNDYDAGDAALGDAGGSVGLCLACSQTNCATQVAACNADCYCPSDIKDFYTCISGGGSFTTCGAPLVQNADTAEQNLGTCVLGACADPCNLHFGAADGGAHDAASDSPSDAPSNG